ncbi:MAG: kinase/pyrophosphorylase [Candidatus Latescibacterota bacterium]|nr:MAG: kinase/pyrophosphorylase [Candidatus Latescibacterota bacterium]
MSAPQGPPKRRRHVFVVSDATGATCETVVKAALSQFTSTDVVLERFSEIRSEKQIEEVVERAAEVEGVVVYTMVSIELRQKMLQLGLRRGVSTIDILGPILTRLADHLELSPRSQPGLFRHLNRMYYARIDAVDFTVKHDDGLGADTIDRAEIVLVGVSRTSKTPVSLYLSFRGWKVANIPVIYGLDLPAQLLKIDQRKIVGLYMQPQQLHALRRRRRDHLRAHGMGDYADPDGIDQELKLSRRLFTKHGWPILDVTAKAIEEISSEVMQILFTRTGESKNSHSRA